MFAYNSTFGQPSATSGFGSKPACESSFANNPNTGNSMFNATSTGLFGAKQSSSPLAYTVTFGSSSAPSFTSSVPAFGGFALGGTSSTGAFSGVSSSAPGFGAFTKPFGGAASAFGEFGSSMASPPRSSGFGAFRASSSALGVSSTPSFNFGLGSSNSQSSSALGVSSTPSFNFGVSPSNSQSSFALGVSSTPSFNFSSGTSTTIGKSVSHGKPKGSRVAGYRPTLVTNDTYSKKGPEKCVSISAMHDYNGKSHDELRWEDYELRDKAPPVVKSNPFGFLPAFVPSSIKPQVSEPLFTFQTTTSNPNLATSPFAPFSTTPASVTTSSTVPPSFPSPFVTPNTSASTTTCKFSPFGPSAPGNSFLTTSPKPLEGNLFRSPFVSSSFPASSSTFTFSPFGPSPTIMPATCKSPPMSPSPTANNFLTTPPKPLEGNLFPSSFVPSSSPASTSSFSPFGPSPTIMPATTSSTTQNSAPSLSSPPSSSTSVSLPSISSSPTPSILPTVNQPIQDPQKLAASTVSEKTMSVQSVSLQNPFGTPSLLPHMSTVQYGISSLAVADKPTPVRVTSLLTTRHLSQRRSRLPARKLHPRVPFYCDDEESLSTKMADTLFIIPRENPRALLICPNVKEDHSKGATVSEHEAEVEALIPKLKQKDYYTEPLVQELAAKERAEPGFCQHVKDFVVGRHGFGSIMFAGETDVRKLDLESLVQFDAREITVYTDASKKPPVGEGLNKPAVVTLLNIKCFDKKTGQQITKGAKMEKYKDLLVKKAREQGAEFVSYNPLKGEWRFRVEHF